MCDGLFFLRLLEKKFVAVNRVSFEYKLCFDDKGLYYGFYDKKSICEDVAFMIKYEDVAFMIK